ncbi:short neuropeptide F [Euwallacea fornicatus]|uniref:short neuropeptide F n=1 Tax=Euwallacea fornicatus TaxID=995702 RepID=UPI0027A5B2B2|nr:putative short neuropeptide F [Euwallacea interjectus]
MNRSSAVKIFSLFACLMLFVANVTSAPSSWNGENDSSIRELIDMLLQRENMEDSRLGYHTVSRKAGRSPQLRLRFGKRSDSQYAIPAYLSAIYDTPNEN